MVRIVKLQIFIYERKINKITSIIVHIIKCNYIYNCTKSVKISYKYSYSQI